VRLTCGVRRCRRSLGMCVRCGRRWRRRGLRRWLRIRRRRWRISRIVRRCRCRFRGRRGRLASRVSREPRGRTGRWARLVLRAWPVRLVLLGLGARLGRLVLRVSVARRGRRVSRVLLGRRVLLVTAWWRRRGIRMRWCVGGMGRRIRGRGTGTAGRGCWGWILDAPNTRSCNAGDMSGDLVIAELWRGGECIARWTDQEGPPNLGERLPRLREAGWTIHDFREMAGTTP